MLPKGTHMSMLWILACPLIPDAQALEIANHLARYSLRENICAVEQVRPLPSPLPAHPTPRDIAEHPARYGIAQTLQAIDTLKRERKNP